MGARHALQGRCEWEHRAGDGLRLVAQAISVVAAAASGACNLASAAPQPGFPPMRQADGTPESGSGGPHRCLVLRHLADEVDVGAGGGVGVGVLAHVHAPLLHGARGA